MASIVLTVVGTAIGGPIGGLVGGLVGRSVDRAIFGGTSSRTIEGRRLKDLTVQTSAYGEPVSRVYGTMRLPGNVIWSSGLTESRSENTEGGGGKGGGQKVTTVTYSYAASFAVALSARQIADVGRIWADGKLLRDGAGKLAVGGSMRLYNGTDFQKADTMIEAIEGMANVNAFRGLAYVVFEDMALGEYANRIPNLTFEVIADSGGSISLSSVVADICRLSGVSSFDVSDLIQTVEGYMLPGPMKSRAAIEELAQIYNFDVVEQEGSLLFRRLDREADVVIPSDDILQVDRKTDRSGKISLTRQQDLDLPREIGLSFIDPARDYQTGFQRARRLTATSDIVRQSAHPLVITANAAKTASEIQLDLAWGGRETAQFSLPHKYDDLTAGDIVTLPLGLEQEDFMLQETEIGLQGMDCRAVRFSKSLLNRNSLADSGTAPAQQVFPLATSQFLPLDMPTITGENVSSPVLFWTAGAGSGKWDGAGLFISRDNDQSYSQIDFTATDVVSGIVVNTLAAGPTAYWDEGNDLLVTLDNSSDVLSTETADGVLGGANVVWVGGEIIQFREALLEPDGRYRLSGLLRGRRGTEGKIASHGAAEIFVLLMESTIRPAALRFSDIGRTYQYKAVTSGALVADALPINHTFGAAVLKPFAPVHASGVRDGAGNLTISWIRRSRVGGDWQDNADVPLGELYEKYDIEILSGATVVRTLTSNGPQVIYSANFQNMDFGGLQASLAVRISQISDAVGRGWPRDVTL